MTWLEAALLGLIQGLTEFIPVSSDGHLSAAEMLMPDFAQVGLLFDVMVHVGTLTAIVVYYRALLREEAAGSRRGRPREGTAARGASWRSFWWRRFRPPSSASSSNPVETTKLDPRFVGAMEIVTGLYLLLSAFRREGRKDRDTMPYLDAALIGVAKGSRFCRASRGRPRRSPWGCSWASRRAGRPTSRFSWRSRPSSAPTSLEIVSALRHQGARVFPNARLRQVPPRRGHRGSHGLFHDRFSHTAGSTRKVHSSRSTASSSGSC